MKSPTQAILEKCKFSSINYAGVKLGEQILGPHEEKALTASEARMKELIDG